MKAKEDKIKSLTKAYARRQQKYFRKRTIKPNYLRSSSTSTNTNNVPTSTSFSRYSVRIPRFFYIACFGIFITACFFTTETWFHIYVKDQQNHHHVSMQKPNSRSADHPIKIRSNSRSIDHHEKQHMQQPYNLVKEDTNTDLDTNTETVKDHETTKKSSKTSTITLLEESKYTDSKCLLSLSDLIDTERYPQKGIRHMVDPPPDDVTDITLVCCETTAGSISIAVHSKWAPIGAERFLDMVQSNYFDTKVPLMRCMKNFLCQFGIAGKPSFTKLYDKSIPDDPNWLPEGKEFRTNDNGVKRYAKGYMAFAGAGPNTRSNQLIMALGNNKFLGGGSPWEVPWGEVVGEHSFLTLDAIYTGYGDNGPSQGRLRKEGASESIQHDFPDLDYIRSCHVVDPIKQT